MDTGVILLNLGGPDNLQSVKPFLYNLFSDREIIKLGPKFLQRQIAWLISTLRAGKSISMYKQIGGGSPILEITKSQGRRLEEYIASSLGYKVYVGMRYWHPYIKDTVNQMEDDGIKNIIALTLYPHYSKATTGSAFSELKRALIGRNIDCRFIESWFDNVYYIDALIDLIDQGISQFNGRLKDILFSAHGLPVSFIKEGDPYVQHINKTMDSLRKKYASFTFHLSYQSRSGPVQWLAPSTEDMINELAHKGISNLLVVPISFVSDHIETLYEIDIKYKKLSEMNNMTMRRIESLNTHPLFIKTLAEMIKI
ncbi:MAG: ferrochelatase [Nitrospirae bacterium]|nr:ferrochelatase [Nitrospirota bacterium]